MSMNSNNSSSNELSEQLKSLIIRYMTASNEGDHASAEALLLQIQQYNRDHLEGEL